MMKRLLLITLFIGLKLGLTAQPFDWSVTANGMYRDGVPFFMEGQSWAKQTPITYNLGTSCEADLKSKLTELNAIGVNTLRVYGSPDDTDWSGTSNFGNLIKWIEEWNNDNPDGGDPNKAMYYFVQINPADDESTLTDDLPHNTTASFDRAINDLGNSGSVASLVSQVNAITGGSEYLLGYMIYHELNGSNKYIDWYASIGAGGIESFMNEVADALHNTYAPGKLVTHTGDAKQPTDDLYELIENLDSSDGNVLANFDIIGFNLYISTTQMLNEGVYYDRIPQRRGFSVNSNRGWYIGETGASSDVAAATSIPAVNYTQSQGMANLQLMWQKSEELGNLLGFVLFTVQDNDLGAVVSDDIKQRGYFDVYGDKKMLFYAYSDVMGQISTNDRYHETGEHVLDVVIDENNSDYTITFEFENKTTSSKDFFWSIYADAGTGNQRFTALVDEAYIVLSAGQSTSVVKIVTKSGSNDLLAIESIAIDELNPSNSYSYGRRHLLSDAIGTVAGLNLNVNNLPDRPSGPDVLSLSTSNVSFGESSSSQNVNVTSNASWSVSDNASWITISPASGSNNGTFSISATGNSTTSSRSGTVTVSSGSLSETVSVSQSGVAAGGNLPSPWVTQDIGAVSATGSATYSSGIFNMEGSGADIWGTTDEFRYVNQIVSGDVSITARVASIENTNVWAKAGVMIRESLDVGSKHAMSVITPSRGTSFQRRLNTGGSSAHSTISSVSAPYWVRLVRSGNTFTSYYSSDGSSWTSHGSSTLTMSTDVYVGLVTTSHDDGVLCRASIDNVTVSSANVSVPSAPSSLAATGITASQIDLTWSDNSSDEDLFILERSENGISSWVQIASLGANNTSYSNTGLTASKTYYYRLLASNSAGNSIYSATASATTKSDVGTSVTVTLNPTDDAYIRGGAYSTSNFGSDANLVVKEGTVADYFRKALLQFDYNAEGLLQVSSAVLRVYASTANALDVSAYEINDSWDESAVTWSNAPTAGSIVEVTTLSSAAQYYEWDVTSYVQTELSNDEVVSMILVDASSSNVQLVFNAKEAASNPPELVISGTASSSSRISDHSNELLTKVENTINVYPNPSQGKIFVTGIDESYDQFYLIDLSGQQVLKGRVTNKSIDLSTVPSGIWLLQIQGNTNAVIRRKIVLN